MIEGRGAVSPPYYRGKEGHHPEISPCRGKGRRIEIFRRCPGKKKRLGEKRGPIPLTITKKEKGRGIDGRKAIIRPFRGKGHAEGKRRAAPGHD